jgi:hypothetical protein
MGQKPFEGCRRNRSPNQPLDDDGIGSVKGMQIGVRCPLFEGVSHVLDLSEGSSKLIPIHEEPNHQIVHLFRLGKADRPTH